VLTFFLLDQKEPKSQDKPDPSGRFVGPSRARVETWHFDHPRAVTLQGHCPSAVGRMPPGGDPKCLISLVLFYQEKRTDKETNSKKISPLD